MSGFAVELGNGLDADRNTELFGHKLSKRCANALSNFYIAGEDRNSAVFADMHPRTARPRRRTESVVPDRRPALGAVGDEAVVLK
jgi:hypothetical protein